MSYDSFSTLHFVVPRLLRPTSHMFKAIKQKTSMLPTVPRYPFIFVFCVPKVTRKKIRSSKLLIFLKKFQEKVIELE